MFINFNVLIMNAFNVCLACLSMPGSFSFQIYHIIIRLRVPNFAIVLCLF